MLKYHTFFGDIFSLWNYQYTNSNTKNMDAERTTMLIWFHLRPFGTILEHFGTFGAIWEHLGTFGNIWDNFGSFETILDHLRPFWIILNHFGSFTMRMSVHPPLTGPQDKYECNTDSFKKKIHLTVHDLCYSCIKA